MSASSRAIVEPGKLAYPFAFTWAQLGELGVPVAVLAIVVALITPLPSFLLDFLLVTDLMLSVIVMMVAMYIRKPVEFSVFPTTLLLLTLFRLALNVSSSRLILLNGNSGTSAAGHVIEAFGNFVVGGNYVIGAVIFLVLIAIQYVVINHGAVRISEVTARFTLDALPGKQMSIDADLNAGLVDETEARKRRRQLSAEAEFYGAMDGASRFTQRDAVASILITGINIVAGFLIGVLQHGMDMKKAIQTYTVLTIGDGLVTVIPALMISVSGGLVVTRAGSDERLGTEFQSQLFTNPQPLMLASAVMCALSAFPGLPTVPFLLLGGSLGVVAYYRSKKAQEELPTPAAAQKPAKENIEALFKLEPITLEVGLGLTSLVQGGDSSPLLQKIGSVRRQLASQLGFLLPAVRVHDNMALRSREYVILLRGVELDRFDLLQGHDLAIPTGEIDPAIPARPTREPAFGVPAFWVPAERAEQARRSGYTVVDAVNVLGTHLSELIRRNAHEIFTRQDTKTYCDRVAQENPKAVEDLVPKQLPLATVQRVLQNLLRERVSIRDSVCIVESLGEASGMTRNPVILTEYVRQALRRSLVKPFLTTTGEINAYFLESNIEQLIESKVSHAENNSVLSLAPTVVRDILARIERKVGGVGASAVIITSSAIRHFLRQIVEPVHPHVTILAHNEIPPGTRVVSLGVVD